MPLCWLCNGEIVYFQVKIPELRMRKIAALWLFNKKWTTYCKADFRIKMLLNSLAGKLILKRVLVFYR